MVFDFGLVRNIRRGQNCHVVAEVWMYLPYTACVFHMALLVAVKCPSGMAPPACSAPRHALVPPPLLTCTAPVLNILLPTHVLLPFTHVPPLHFCTVPHTSAPLPTCPYLQSFVPPPTLLYRFPHSHTYMHTQPCHPQFTVPGVVGCVVSNAHPELRSFAEAQIARSLLATPPSPPLTTTATATATAAGTSPVGASGGQGVEAGSVGAAATAGGVPSIHEPTGATAGGATAAPVAATAKSITAGAGVSGPTPMGSMSPASSLTSTPSSGPHSTVVPNIFLATLPCAGGILQAMAHFGFLSPGYAPAAAAAALTPAPSGAEGLGSGVSVPLASGALTSGRSVPMGGAAGHAAGAAAAGHAGSVGARPHVTSPCPGVPAPMAGVAAFQACPQDVHMSEHAPEVKPGAPAAAAGYFPEEETGGKTQGADVAGAAGGDGKLVGSAAGKQAGGATKRAYAGMEPQGATQSDTQQADMGRGSHGFGSGAHAVPEPTPGVPAAMAGLPEGGHGSVMSMTDDTGAIPMTHAVPDPHPGAPPGAAGLSQEQAQSSEFVPTGGCEAYLHPPARTAGRTSGATAVAAVAAGGGGSGPVPGECFPGGAGDTGGMQLAAGIPEQALQHRDSHGLAPASAYTGHWCAISTPERGVREFAWRLGVALAEPLASNITLPTDLIGHSSIRLFVSNDCVVEMVPACRRTGSSVRRLPHAGSGSLPMGGMPTGGSPLSQGFGRTSTPTYGTSDPAMAFRGSRLSMPGSAAVPGMGSSAIAPETPPLSPVSRHRTAPVGSGSLMAGSGDMDMPGLTGPGAGLTGSARQSDREAREIEADLTPLGVADAAAGPDASMGQSKAWIDGLEVNARPPPPSLMVKAFEAAEGGEGAEKKEGDTENVEVPTRQWDLSFRVSFDSASCMSDMWRICVWLLSDLCLTCA